MAPDLVALAMGFNLLESLQDASQESKGVLPPRLCASSRAPLVPDCSVVRRTIQTMYCFLLPIKKGKGGLERQQLSGEGVC